MADEERKKISEFPASQSLPDDALLLLEINGTTFNVSGAVIKAIAANAVPYIGMVNGKPYWFVWDADSEQFVQSVSAEGQEGRQPTVSIEETSTGTEIKFTTAEGEQIAHIKNGASVVLRYTNKEIQWKRDTLIDTRWKTLVSLEEIRGTALSSAIQEVKTYAADAKSNADSARKSAQNAEAAQDDVEARAGEFEAKLEEKGDGLWVDPDTNLLYLTSNGMVIGDGVFVNTGTGGGGSGGQVTSYVVTLENLLTERNINIAQGASVVLSVKYRSVDADEYDDGPGIGTITINSVKAATVTVQQGNNMIDVTSLLKTGFNTVKIRVENSEGSARSITYSVNVVALNLTTTMEKMAIYDGTVTFPYTLTGTGEKTVHFFMDGKKIGAEVVQTSGRSNSFDIPAQEHGAHEFKAYATIEMAGEQIRSNEVTLQMIWISNGNQTPVVASTFQKRVATQGEALVIEYMAYDPNSEQAAVQLTVKKDGIQYSQKAVTVGRTVQSWAVSDYPAGNVTFEISCGNASLTLPVTVEESAFEMEPITDGLQLEFTAEGRSNAEENPAKWEYKGIQASFSGFGFTGADGWVDDENGQTALRFLPGDEMVIPFMPFASDARQTGFAIEAEFETRDVRDYDSVVLSSTQGGRGFVIKSQSAELKSEQSSVQMQFKEDSRVRIAFVVEPRTMHRLIYIYVNGIMCGVQQYPAADDFSQPLPVGITIGAESCGLQLYRVRCYSKGLTRFEQLDNYICDRPTLAERLQTAQENNILNEQEEVSLNKLPATLPYLIIETPELPQYKGDKKSGVSLTFVDPANSGRSWTASNVDLDVQGTSSAGYPVKNEKLKLKSGIVYSSDNRPADGFQIHPGSVETRVITIKVDYASSEGANNVELVELYNRTCPYKTEPQQEDPKVRQGIEGIAIALFWQNTTNNQTTFIGKANLNTDKGNEETFGFTDEYPAAESWEFLNNTSNRTLFKVSNFGTGWENDFEARYPDGNKNTAAFKRMTDFVAAHNRDTVETEEEKDAMLEDFKNHFSEFFRTDAMLFYYLFTEVFLMVDSRAKNMFMTTYDGLHWLPLPYDMDTAIGINNEGALAFSYSLEDTDTVGGAKVFNGQDSVLWINVRDAFAGELKTMYAALRSGPEFNYETIRDMFTDHQSVWPEALWNEDAFVKYLQPYLLNGENYLSMLQGDKASQRDWWLFNAFRYRDSKYHSGDALDQFITLRCYSLGAITVTPYSDIYPAIKYGSYLVQKRGARNVPCLLENPNDTLNDTEVYIYSADRIADVGDLSGLQVGYANFAAAGKLQSLKLGDDDDGYENTNLTELFVGNNELLTDIDVSNCSALSMPVDLSGCVSLETVKAGGTAITGIQLPNGGHLRSMILPGTMTNLTIQNQKNIETISIAGTSKLATLRVENTPNIDLEEMILGADNLNRVRLIGVEWNAASSDRLIATVRKLAGCIGVDANGNNTAKAVVTGRVNVPSITGDALEEISETFPELVVIVNGVANYIIRFLGYDGRVLFRQTVTMGGNAYDPVAGGQIEAPKRPGTDEVRYTFTGWGTLPTNVSKNMAVTAMFAEAFRVRFVNWDGNVLQTTYVTSGGTATYTGTTPSRDSDEKYNYNFSGWDGEQTNINSARDITAKYIGEIRKYTVYFYNGGILLQTVKNINYGGSATYTGERPVDPSGENMPFEKWDPSPTNITGDTYCYAKFMSAFEIAEIADDWETIIDNVENGTYATKYKVGNYKPLDLGAEGVVNMQIAGFDKDELSDGTGKAHITWIAKELLANGQRMNTNTKGAVGGWEGSEMRGYLKNTVKNLIPDVVRSAIVEVTKTQNSFMADGASEKQTTNDYVWLPEWNEIGGYFPLYGTLFNGNESRKKKKVGATGYSYWWNRNAVDKSTFDSVGTDGTRYKNAAGYSYGVAIGFCI